MTRYMVGKVEVVPNDWDGAVGAGGGRPRAAKEGAVMSADVVKAARAAFDQAKDEAWEAYWANPYGAGRAREYFRARDRARAQYYEALAKMAP